MKFSLPDLGEAPIAVPCSEWEYRILIRIPDFVQKENLEAAKENTFAKKGIHHEIYPSDPRKTATEKLKTILREPAYQVIYQLNLFCKRPIEKSRINNPNISSLIGVLNGNSTGSISLICMIRFRVDSF